MFSENGIQRKSNGSVSPVRPRDSISHHYGRAIELSEDMKSSLERVRKRKTTKKSRNSEISNNYKTLSKTDVEKMLLHTQGLRTRRQNAEDSTKASKRDTKSKELLLSQSTLEDDFHGNVELEDINSGNFVLLNKRSKVWERVRESNRRVQRTSWGQGLLESIKKEQYTRVVLDRTRRKQINSFEDLNVKETRRERRGKERIFYGAKVALYNPQTKLYLSISPNQEETSLSPTITRFFIVNLDDPKSTAPVLFGDRVGFCTLNMKKALGTKFVLSYKGLHVCAVENDNKAQLTAKWKVIDPENVVNSFAAPQPHCTVAHLDQIGLEHNDRFLSTREGQLQLTGAGKATVEGGSVWVLQLLANASIKKVPSAQKVLMHAQTQIRELKDSKKEKQLFAKLIRKDMHAFAKQTDAQYLSFDPTNFKVQGDNSVQRYFRERWEETFKHFPHDTVAKRAASEALVLSTNSVICAEEDEEGRNDIAEPDQETKQKLLRYILPLGGSSMCLAAKSSLKAKKEPPPTPKDTLDQAKIRALTHRLEMQVPTLVWQQIRAQSSLEDQKEREKKDQAARCIQNMFRRWKQRKWTREFRGLDEACEDEVKEDIKADQAAAANKSPTPKARQRLSTQTFNKLQRSETYHSVHSAMKSMKKLPSAKSTTSLPLRRGLSRTATESSSFELVSKDMQFREYRNPNDDDEEEEQARFLLDENRTIESHLRVLQRVNPKLYGDVPTSFTSPPLPSIGDIIHTSTKRQHSNNTRPVRPKSKYMSRPKSAANLLPFQVTSAHENRRPVSANPFT